MKRNIFRILRTTAAASLMVALLNIGNAAAYECLSVSGCNGDTTSLFGQTQAYDVLLRGNGEAVVNARITLDNQSSPSVNKLSYAVAQGQLGDVTAYQEITCSDLPTILPLNSSSTVKTPAVSGVSGTTDQTSLKDFPECYPNDNERYTGATTYQPSYYYPSGYTYKAVTVKKSGNTFDLSLPQTVKNKQDTTIVMLYNVTGVATKGFGGVFHYNFKTLKSASPVSDVTVAVTTDENYVLADSAKSNVNYRSATSSSSLSKSLNVGAQGASSASDSYIKSIGTDGDTTKHASSLSANETFTVSGKFASSSWQMTWPQTLLKLAIALAAIGLLIFFYRRNQRRLKDKPIEKQETKQTPAQAEKPAVIQPTENEQQDEVTPNYDLKQRGTINLQALPFYWLFSSIGLHFRERRVRPVFVGWLLGLMGVAIVSLALFASAALMDHVTQSTSLDSGIGALTSYVAFMSLAALGFLGFLFFCVYLPIVYAQSLRHATRIFVHILLFLAVISGVMYFASMRSDNSTTTQPYIGNCGIEQNIKSQICYGAD